MGDYGLFESDEASQNEPRLAAKTATRQLEAAIDVVRAKFGKFLLGATGIDEFGDRWHYSKSDIRSAVEPHVFPNTGTMRRIQNAMKADWKVAHPYKLALGEGETPTGGPLEGPMDLGYSDLPERYRPRSEDDLDMPMVDKLHQQYHDDPFRKYGPELDPAAGHAGFGEFSEFGPDQWDYDAINRMTDSRQEHERGRTSNRRQALSHDEAGYGQMETDNTRSNQDLDETYHPSSGNLVPEGNFEGYKDSVDQGGPEKVQSHDFTPGGDSGRQARRRQAGDGVSWYDQAERDDDNWGRGKKSEDDDSKKEAARLVADIYTDFARTNGLRVASLETLDHYASTGIHDADYRLLQALITRQAECDEDCDDDEDTESEAPSASESDESESGDDEGEDYDFGGEDDAEGEEEAPEDGDTEESDEDYDFGGEDEGEEDQGGGEQYTVPEEAPELPPEMMAEIPQDDASGSAPVPPEVVDSLLGLPEGTIEQLLLEEVEQGSQGGDPGMSGPPAPPQGGGDDFFGGGGDDAEQEPSRVARRRQATPKGLKDKTNEYGRKKAPAKTKTPGGYEREPVDSADAMDMDRERQIEDGNRKRDAARRFWAAEGDPEQESGGGGEQAAPAQDPAAAMGGGDPAAMGMGQPMMPPPGSQAVTPPQAPAPLENQPAEDALLDTANQAIMQMIDQETAEYQQIIDPLSQALQAIQFAQQVEQSEHPMDVTPPQGTVDVSPAAAPGGAGNPMQQQAMRRWAGEHNDNFQDMEIDYVQDLADSGHPGARSYLEKFYEKPEGYFTDENYSGPGIPDRANNPYYEASRRRAAVPYPDPDRRKTWDWDKGHRPSEDSTEFGDVSHDGVANRPQDRQAKVEFGIRNAAALIASRYRLSATGHQMLLNAALGRRGYEHVVEALKLVPPEVRKAAAIHMSHLFSAGNQRFNKDVFMKTVMASNPRDRAGDAWRDGRDRGEREHGRHDMDEGYYRDENDPNSWELHNDGYQPGNITGSRGRLPFDRPRLAGETWTNTPLMDEFEFPDPGQPETRDKHTVNDLPKLPGGHIGASQKAVDRFQRWQKNQQQKGLPTTQGESAVHNFLQTSKPYKKRVGPDAANMIHQELGLEPDAVKTPKAKPVKAVNPTLKGKGGKTPAAPKAKAPAPKAAPKTASFFTRKVPGWRWDDHLSGYLSKEARAFTCSCGQKIASPSYKTCSCGKVWNVYAIGDSHHLASDTAEVYIAREIPVRPGVIMANKKMANAGVPDIHDHIHEMGDDGLPTWLTDPYERDHAAAWRDMGKHEKFADYLADRAYNKHQDISLADGRDPNESTTWYARSCQADDYLKAVQQHLGGGHTANKKMAGDPEFRGPAADLREGDHVRHLSPSYHGKGVVHAVHPEHGVGVTWAVDMGDPVQSWEHPGDLRKIGNAAQKSRRELLAEIERLADWTKYDSPDPTRDPKVKPPSTKIKSQPGDWTNRDFTGPTKGQWREPDPTELPRKTRKKK